MIHVEKCVCFCLLLKGNSGIRYMLDGRWFAFFTTTSPSPTPLDDTAVQAAVYVAEFTWDIPHIAQAANVVTDTLSRPPGHAAAGRPPSVATCVNVTSWSQVTALRRGKLNSSSPSLPGAADGMAHMQPAAGISFSRMAANQVSCPNTHCRPLSPPP